MNGGFVYYSAVKKTSLFCACMLNIVNCREVACEETERFVLSSTNLSQVYTHIKISYLLLMQTFLKVSNVLKHLEEIKKANMEKFVNNLRNELHSLWDKCFYSPDQRNSFRCVSSLRNLFSN